MKKFKWIGAASLIAVLSACSGDSSSNASANSEGNPPAGNSLVSSSSVVGDTVRFDASGNVGELTDSRDGHVYKAVKIGDQVWMAEDLIYSHENVELADCSTWTAYPLTCEQFNSQVRFQYSWAEVVDSVNTGCGENGATVSGVKLQKCPLALPAQSLCPDGWHVPSVAEWQVLIDFAGGGSVAGGILKIDSGWAGVGNGSNDLGFNAKPTDGNEEGCFYTTDQNDDGSFKLLCMTSKNAHAEFVESRRHFHESFIRCLQGAGKKGLDYVVNAADETYAGNFGTLTDSRDGKKYKTVEIGEQTWMAENLKYKDKDLYEYDEVMDAEVTHCYREELDWGSDFGMWDACPVKQPIQGICPDGWRLPTAEDWNILAAYVSGTEYTTDFVSSSVAGYMLKSTSGWTTPGLDAFGFGAHPIEDDEGFFWASTVTGYADWFGSDMLWIRGDEAVVKTVDWVELSPVRCLKGNGNKEPASWSNEDPVEESGSSSSSSSSSSIIAAYSGPYGELKDERDGNIYRTVVIDGQTWMADNLKFETPNGKSKCNCADTTSCDSRGRLYDWATAQTACPAGWHLPTYGEFEMLGIFAAKAGYDLGGNYGVRALLGATTGWNNLTSYNLFGFSALPGGMASANKTENYCWHSGNTAIENEVSFACYWSSSEDESGAHAYLNLVEDPNGKEPLLAWGDDPEITYIDPLAMSVRCLKD